VTEYFLGVDVGATKSHALIADECGQVVGFGSNGPGNHEVVGYEGLVQVLNHSVSQALADAGISKNDLAGAGFGIAGYDWPSEKELMLRAIQTLGLMVPFEFVNDAVIGLLAGTSEGWGVAVVAGTSNNCRGRDGQGREGRVTGAGSLMGEHAGASELVEEAVRAVSRAWSKRGPATSLTQTFIDLVGAKDEMDLLEGLVLNRYYLPAAAAPAIFQVADQGDIVAQEIISWAGRELGSLAVGVIRQLGFEQLEVEVIMIGSLFKGGPRLTGAMATTVHVVAPRARLVRLEAPPVVGGVLLGMERAGVEYRHVRPTLIETTNTLLNGA
jgi:N-acetylglucosamine kinase-like BadF-type ATPase